jgi:hypothetical protein
VSLRLRLFASYLLLLALAIGVIALTLLLFLNSAPEPNAPTYQRLANVMQGFNLEEVASDFLEQNPDRQTITEQDLLRTFALSRDIRILLVSTTPLDPNNVLFDSAEVFQRGESIDLMEDNRYEFPSFERWVEITSGMSVKFGEFIDLEGEEWLYTALIDTSPLGRWSGAILFADRQSTRTLQTAIRRITCNPTHTICHDRLDRRVYPRRAHQQHHRPPLEELRFCCKSGCTG